MRLSRGGRRIKAFSLVEVVIALGVTAISLLAIISLFPVGMGAATDSRRETRAAYLAQQIADDLQTSPFTSAVILQSSGGLSVMTNINLSVPQSYAFACDASENLVSSITLNQYTNGYLNPGVVSVVQVSVTPTGLTNLSQVVIEASAPAGAALTSRSRFSFSTQIGNQY